MSEEIRGYTVERAAANIDNVFAAGDVAVTFDPITGERIVTGLWTNAVEMGRSVLILVPA